MKRKVLSMLISTTTAVSMFSTFANAEVKDDSVNTTQDKSVVSNESYENLSDLEDNNDLEVTNETTTGAAITSDIALSISPDIIVDKQYSGNEGENVGGIPTYNTISSAMQSINKDNSDEKIIFIKNGIYKEKLTIAVPNITLVGESAAHTVITYDDASGTIKRSEDGGDGVVTYGTSSSSSVTIKESAENFKAANLTIANSFDEDVNSAIANKQAVAMKNEADKSIFENCRFIGNQDTLYANKKRQYYHNCFICGDVDFIFGGAQAVFDNCEIKSINREGISPKGYVAAPSTLQDNVYGFLIQNSKLTSNINEKGSVYLGRPWHPSSEINLGHTVISNVVYENCDLGAHIAADGWSTMSNAGVITNPLDNDMYEYNNYGESSANGENSNRRQLENIDKYNKENILNNWDPRDDVKMLASYPEDERDYDENEDYSDFIKDDYADTSDDDNTGNSSTETSDNVAEKVNWNSTVFGVTTSKENNEINVATDENGKKVINLRSGNSDGTNAGGKVTGSNDGISYYYTEIDPSENFELSANVKVNYFEKTKPDKQCGFGIMARDQLGVANDVSTAPSNMVLVGGYKANIESVYRSGVTKDLDGKITMNGEHKFADRPANDGSATYKLTLKKTNTGYICSVDDGEEVTYYEPKLLEVADSGKIYVGFFTARIASIQVSNINLTKSNVATDPAGESKPAEVIVPELNIKSGYATGSTSYDFKVQPTVKGNLNIKLNDSNVYSGKADSESILSVPTVLKSGDNKFEIEYTPYVTDNNTDTTVINKTFIVNVKSYGVEKGDIYVSPNGTESGDGTIDNPIDIYSAVKYVNNGQTIKVKGGTYNLISPVTIESTNNGTKDNMKSFESYDGRAIFDFGKVSKGFFLNGSYWNIKGIDVTNTADANAGLRVAGNYNILENIKTYKNGDTGLQISSLSTDDPKELWPKYNEIINCDSYDNMDAAMNNADGFAAKLTTGEGNVFKGCVSHNNCDDGWDLFSKLEIGKIGAVTIENCIAYGNGTLSDGTVTKGDGNGFKLGGEGLPVKHTLLNSLSFNNDAAGVTGNSNPACVVKNTISSDNYKNYSLDYYTTAILDYEFENDKSFRTVSSDVEDYIPDYVKGETNYFYNGQDSENAEGKKLDKSMFKGTEMPISIERDENNNIIWPEYMALVNASDSGSNDNNSGNNGDSNNSSSGSNSGSSNTGNNSGSQSTTTHHSHSTSSSSSSENISEAIDIDSSTSAGQTEENQELQNNKVKNGWNQNEDKTWFFINSNGEKVQGWLKDGALWYHLNPDGSMQTGWLKDNDGAWYYLSNNGSMKTGWLRDSNGKWYYLNEDGSMKTGWLKDNDGKWYYLNQSGEMIVDTVVDGYVLSSNGQWIY
ncbi:pectinesterase family protein [Clostridium butyricum]|uniref:pectinesterase family protein n=1 Tax=Clostridium butyricum TaxID=1492 RepID=UPI001CA7DB91|nr:pectinesterase family protein [Clostridium butyricum]MBZ0312656.1 exopolygalacturonate lyase [Clostridium butyricum]